MDHDYVPSVAYAMLSDSGIVNAASMDQIRTMITYCVRGERFSDGFWAGVIEDGSLLRILERLEKIRQEMPDQTAYPTEIHKTFWFDRGEPLP